jgi:hypothetical protein
MPFGRHRNQALAEVPSGYLRWFLATCQLTPNLWAAIRAELLGRGADPAGLPPQPDAKPAPSCRRCGGTQLRLCWQALSNTGSRVIRADCRRCGAFVYFAPQTSENVAAADRAEGRTSGPPAAEVFDVRLLAEPGAVPAAVRLRQLLKTGLRSLGLRCTGVQQLSPTPTASQRGTERPEAARQSGEAADAPQANVGG